ncbi:MAG TPA: hypothetical protein VH518_23895 [Tepidisphaeraceae bacterium]|jgi:pimeloyl-ACP methyl ester carboxylesterase
MHPPPPDHKSASVRKLSDGKSLLASHRHVPAGTFHLIVLIAVCFVVGCAQKPMLVVTVGGLGYSQMGNVRHAIQQQCPQADVVSAGWWDAYKADLPRIIRESPRKHLVLVGHSLGCQTIAQTAAKVSKVDLVVFIDPAGDDIRLPRTVERCLWYQRSNWDWIGQAKVNGASPTKINGGHNEIPQSTELISGVVQAINGIRVDSRH